RKWTVKEMEDRYRKMSKLGVRNIDGYNARVSEAKASGEVLTREIQTGFHRQTGEPIYEVEELALETLPYIVVVVDEMADLMMVAGKEIEGAIQRLAQMARAAGIHIVMATQRPSVDVITGTIKAQKDQAGKWGVAQIPTINVPGAVAASNLGGSSWYVLGTSKVKAEAADFLNAIYAKDADFYQAI
ncbi:hypothetical protein J8J40_21440, partial [Mycobacterium tuberculosis]|nr:hypothetical protein [Mycobacterium tuberculosis]